MPNSFRLEASISAGARAGLESCRIMPSCPRADGLGTQRPKRMRQPCPQLCRCYEADEGRRSLPSLSFVHDLAAKEIDKWTKQPPRPLPRILSTARWS